MDVDKLFEEIMLDMPNYNEFRSSAVHSPQKKDDANSRYAVLSLGVGVGGMLVVPDLVLVCRTIAPSSQSSSERNSSQFEKEIRKVCVIGSKC